MMPIRIQRKRTKGWRMPENTIYVGRPTKWGNPFTLRDLEGSEVSPSKTMVDLYEEMTKFATDEELQRWLEPLRGKDLACWCALDKPCHADILLKLANAEVSNET